MATTSGCPLRGGNSHEASYLGMYRALYLGERILVFSLADMVPNGKRPLHR
jgi:hypothetical protein